MLYIDKHHNIYSQIFTLPLLSTCPIPSPLSDSFFKITLIYTYKKHLCHLLSVSI